MIDLNESRKNIDEIDAKIVELFEKRMIEANEVARYKMETGKPVFDKEREEAKLDRLQSLSESEFNKRAVNELFSQIMSISRKYQYGVLPETERITEFVKVDKLPRREDDKIMYYGVPGTHTQQAMEDFFGENINSISCKTFKGVMEAIEKGEATYGVLPIENSSTGGISDNYDLLLKYSNAIVGEHILKIDQCLMALPGAKVEDIEVVYSHPQGIMQCSDYLDAHPKMKQVEQASTAECAMKVAASGDITKAAIASRKAAQLYGLDIIGDSIQREQNNHTRFIIVGKQPIYFEESNRIALCFELPHSSGSLYGVLSHFLYNDLNLTLIESRPIKGKSWEYRFFVDVEGNLDMSGVKNALRGIKEEAAYLRVLGNFKSNV